MSTPPQSPLARRVQACCPLLTCSVALVSKSPPVAFYEKGEASWLLFVEARTHELVEAGLDIIARSGRLVKSSGDVSSERLVLLELLENVLEGRLPSALHDGWGQPVGKVIDDTSDRQCPDGDAYQDVKTGQSPLWLMALRLLLVGLRLLLVGLGAAGVKRVRSSEPEHGQALVVGAATDGQRPTVRLPPASARLVQNLENFTCEIPFRQRSILGFDIHSNVPGSTFNDKLRRPQLDHGARPVARY